MLRKRSALFAVLSAAVALVAGPLASPGSADVLFVSDVSAAITAPSGANGTFGVAGTITNSGTLAQPAGSTLTFSATNGSVTSAPGCSLNAGTATCTVGALSPGQAVTLSVGVTPAPGATSVASQVVATAAQLESNVLDTTNNSDSAVTSVAYAVDAALTNAPADVRNGNDVLLTSTVTNTKAPQTVNAKLVTGGTVDTRLPLPADCAVVDNGANVSCSFVLATGQSRSFDTAVITPAAGSSLVSTLTATGVSGGSDSASTTTNLYSDAQAFVPEGGRLIYQGSNQRTDFWVQPGSAPGLFLKLQEVTLNNVQCGTKGTCIKQAAEALFPHDGKYSGQDVNKPFLWSIKYDERQTCNGTGGGSGCLIDMYWIPSNAGLAGPAQPMPLCPTFSNSAAITTARLNNIDEPCLQKVDKTLKGYATYTVAVLRDIVIPIISSTNK